jgi:hypothetical protein
MTTHAWHDGNMERLGALVRLAPDAARADRVRARCRAQLVRQQRRTARKAAMHAVTWRAAGPLLVGGFCVLYAVVLVATTLRLQGII